MEISDAPHGGTESITDKCARGLVHAMVLGLVLMMSVEMFSRSFLNLSIQMSNELGGYALVAICFLSLATGQSLHAYHRVQFLDRWLSPRADAGLKVAFDIMSLIGTGVLLGEFIRFEILTWNAGDVAATSLMTPLWMPRVFLALGAAALFLALLRTLRDHARQFAVAGSGIEQPK
ncbi:TRAP transporter small permease [Chitinasiproducens palmae]|nr:TRAP transporter small permease subunit [Chitinasiproducens palmae]